MKDRISWSARAESSRLWWVSAALLCAGFIFQVQHYLQALSNPIPIMAVIFLGLGIRLYSLRVCDFEQQLNKAITLVLLVGLGAAALAMPLREVLMHHIQTISLDVAQSPDLSAQLSDYTGALSNRVIGYVGCYIVAYTLVEKARARISRFTALLRYPKTKHEMQAAFHEAAYDSPNLAEYDRLAAAAQRILASETDYFHGRRPLFVNAATDNASLQEMPRHQSSPPTKEDTQASRRA